MYFLIATLDPAWQSLLQNTNSIAQIIGTVLIVIYVIYTYKTFRQIKRQTDYQQDAYLKIEPYIRKDLQLIPTFLPTFSVIEQYQRENLIIKYVSTELPNKFRDTFKRIFNYDSSIYEGSYFTLNLTNYGNAEINRIILNIVVSVSNSQELVDTKMLREKEEVTVTFTIDEIIGRNGNSIQIPLMSTASFPIYEFCVTGFYIDIRNKKYGIGKIIFSNGNPHLQKAQSV